MGEREGREVGMELTYDCGRRPLGFQSRSRVSSEKPVSAKLEELLEVMLSSLEGWEGLAAGDEEAIPTDCRMIDGQTALLPALCNVVYAKLVWIAGLGQVLSQNVGEMEWRQVLRGRVSVGDRWI
jgi:phage tail protein X